MLARRSPGKINVAIAGATEELDAAGSRTGAIVSTEDYHLYWLRRGVTQEEQDDFDTKTDHGNQAHGKFPKVVLDTSADP